MGAYISYLWWGGYDPDAIDPASGLSRRDIYNVRTSWTKVTADSVGSGTELLIRFFSAYPNNREFFKSFKDQSGEELRVNRQFHAHALSIITSLSAVIDNLDKPDLAAIICAKIGSSHNQRQIKELQFNELKNELVKLFIDVLQFNEPTMQSWVKAVTFMYSNIFKELDK